MSEMVKRVQSAIQQVLVDHGVDSEKLARAAIAAMREPTKEMILAGDDMKDDCVDEGTSSDMDGNRYDYTTISSDLPSRVFQAMIDAALK